MFRFTILLLLTIHIAYGQNRFFAVIKNKDTREVLPNASAFIEKIGLGAKSDDSGYLKLANIPNGEFTIVFSYQGYVSQSIRYTFPLADPYQIFEIRLTPEEKELSQVTVTTTRSNSNIDQIPTRIEAVTKEELDEKSTMRPGDIKMLLNESTGISTQPTSAVSGTADIRIQGLDGRYTQLLKDGMPLYNGFSGGLSILQIAPLDLKQVEYIKGAASTLYGGGAIAGLINLISKSPAENRELSLLLNGTSAKGLDASGFYSEKFKHTGTTVYIAENLNKAYDPSNAGFSAIPKTSRFNINPKIFFYSHGKESGFFGISMMYENRLGGDMNVINGQADSIHRYFEKNMSSRFSTEFKYDFHLTGKSKIELKNSEGYFDRTIANPGNVFHGRETLSFTELNYSSVQSKSEWICGLNLWTDHFQSLDTPNLVYTLNTLGAFVQNTFKAAAWLSFETGLRADLNALNNAAFSRVFLLPRLNALVKISPHLSSRIGGGMGYKMPSPFNDEAEEIGYYNIKPINSAITKEEKSYGLNADISYKLKSNETVFSFNQFFYYTRVMQPLVLQNNQFVNANGFIDTKGMETNLILTLDHLNFFLGYTFSDVLQHINQTVSSQPLTPRHRINFDVVYEQENVYRVGLESFYTSAQLLNDGSTGRAYISFGLLLEKIGKHLNTFINAENFTDRRQTRWGTIYTGSITNPLFKDIYTPLEGAVVNAGIKIKL